MADERQNIVELTELELKKVYNDQRLRSINIEKQEIEVIKETIKQLDKEIVSRKTLIQNLAQTTKDFAKSFDKFGKSMKEQKEIVDDVNASLGIVGSKGPNNGETKGTLSSILGELKKFQFGKAASSLSATGAASFGNTIKALSGATGIATAAITALGTAVKYYINNIHEPAAKKEIALSQQLGVGYNQRRYWKNWGFNDWTQRIQLGLSSDEQIALATTAAGIRRPRLDESARTEIETLYKGLMPNYKQWGLDTKTLGTIFKAYTQAGKFPIEKIGGHFYNLMESVQGSGYTIQEFAEVLDNSVMRLKNFGINLDTFAQTAKGYGEYIRQGKISTSAVSATDITQTSIGKRAWLADVLQKHGFINLGLSKSAGPLEKAEALAGLNLSEAQVLEMVSKIAQKPGVEFSGMLEGAANQRERELRLAAIIRNILPQVLPYNLGETTRGLSAHDIATFHATKPSPISTTTPSLEQLETYVQSEEFMKNPMTYLAKTFGVGTLKNLPKIFAAINAMSQLSELFKVFTKEVERILKEIKIADSGEVEKT